MKNKDFINYLTHPYRSVQEGSPPPVDIFIDDGRKGEYTFQENISNTQDIWNRNSPDGGTTNQQLQYDKENYVYVRIRNRGTEFANNITVRGSYSKSSSSSTYPNDWKSMITSEINLSENIAPNGEAIVGPFKWMPKVPGEGNVLMIVNAEGDISNADFITGPVPHSMLVSLDNNIAQRNMA